MSDLFPWEQHSVFGAGLIGCYLGGVLTSLGFETQLVCRTATKAKLNHGIKLSDYQEHQQRVSNVYAIDDKQLISDTSKIKKARFLWLTVKCTGIEQASEDIAPLVDKDTIIFCCQNGLGSDAVLKQRYPDNLVLRVMVPFNVVEMSPGHYHRGSQGQMTIEHTSDSAAGIRALVMSLNSPLLPMATTADMDALLWAKLQLNLGNSVNALADIPVKAMLEQRDYRKVIAVLMTELLQVVDALGITLPKVTSLPAFMIPWVLRLPNFLFVRVANKMLAIDPSVRSSMWWDVSQGKKTEIEHLNGAVIEHGKLLNIACPANTQICVLIRQLSTSHPVKQLEKPPINSCTLLQIISENRVV